MKIGDILEYVGIGIVIVVGIIALVKLLGWL